MIDQIDDPPSPDPAQIQGREAILMTFHADFRQSPWKSTAWKSFCSGHSTRLGFAASA
jgi:hypothetical protein